MIIYQDFGDEYKSGQVNQTVSINKRRSKGTTSKKRALNKKNKIFLKSLGLKVKK